MRGDHNQGHRKDFLIGGAQSEATHRVVSNLYNNLWNLGGHMPPVPPRFLRLWNCTLCKRCDLHNYLLLLPMRFRCLYFEEMLKASNTLTRPPGIHLHPSLQYIYQTSWCFSKNISLCINTLLKCNSYRFCSDWNWTMVGDYNAFLIGRSKGLRMLWGKYREGWESNHLAVMAQWQSTGKSSQRCPGFGLILAVSNH